MKMIIAIIKPFKLDDVRDALGDVCYLRNGGLGRLSFQLVVRYIRRYHRLGP